ncbi:VirB4 family type IV secretion system protein [Archaeoglobus neptunius]|uniref:VirB4 family type IV secretion system protein n=1 Tax=Archaeoglobus neptunius TaxID=2798580 RepID=UPI001925F631|nr:DUF87 domain-containing protein [Archaeoglobus neptunius]
MFRRKKKKKKLEKEESEETEVSEEERVYIERPDTQKIREDIGKSKGRAKKKSRKKREYYYELDGYPFSVMNEIERDQLLSDFQGFLSIVGEGTLLVTVRDEVYRLFDETISVTSKRIFLKTPKQDLTMFGARKLDRDPFEERPRVVKNYPFEVQLSDGSFARTFVAYRFPALLAEGFLYSIFGIADDVALVWYTVPMSKALEIIDRAKRRKEQAVNDSKTEKEYWALVELSRRVASGADLVNYYLMFTVYGRDKNELNEKSSLLQDQLKVFGIEAQSPPFFQKDLYNYSPNVGAGFASLVKRYSDTRSMRVFFPLIAEDLRDEDGIFLGLSGTRSPVEFNIYKRHNYNMVILGVSGAGKSMTAKIYLNRMLRKYGDDLIIFGIDPENEYVTPDVRKYLGINTIVVEENQKLGLDPIRLMNINLMQGEEVLDIAQVAELLSDLYAVPQPLQGTLRAELFTQQGNVENIVEFVENIKDARLRQYFRGATAPPDIYIYEGKPQKLSGSVVFGLREVRNRRLKILISAFLSTYAYSTLLQYGRRAIFFTDEAWLYMDTPSVLNLFENISRRGRKYFLNFLYITQRAEDIARTPEGRTILEQAATALLLRQEKEGIDTLKQIYKLSSHEASMLIDARPGFGLLKAGDKRIAMQVMPTRQEYYTFTTNVAERRAFAADVEDSFSEVEEVVGGGE